MTEANTNTATETTQTTQTAQANQATETQNTGNTATQIETKQNTNFEELIQKAVDRATNKLGNENKNLRKEIDELKKANLSEAELRQLEMQEKEKEIAEREQRLLEKENRLIAIKAIKEIGLDDGSELSLSLVDFVMGADETAIKERVKTFDALVKRFVQAEVDKVFKSNGRSPAKGMANAKESDTQDSVAVRIGQETAKANKAAQTTLDYYIGGNKK